MKKMLFFIGPCSLENEELSLSIARELTEKLHPLRDKIELYFKGSFDKANRSSIESYRGPMLEEGLRILEKVKKETGLPTLTDFHLPEQALPVAEVVDVLQIPAFLCRQTDFVDAGAKACMKYKRQLKIKKGQFVSPNEVENIIGKALRHLSKDDLMITERGFSFGYNNLVVDMASFQTIQSFGVRAIHDATHCVQAPGGLGHVTGGNRQNIKVLARAAVAAGADGVFMETHPEPSKAKSDASTCLSLETIPQMVADLLRLYEVTRELS